MTAPHPPPASTASRGTRLLGGAFTLSMTLPLDNAKTDAR